MPTDVFLFNSLHGCISLRRCLMPGGLLSAISGILAGGILGFGAAEWCVLLDTFARSCFVVWCFAVFTVQDHVIRRHTSCHPFWSHLCQCFLCWVLGVWFLFVVVFWFVVFLFLFWFCVWTDKTSDCVMVCAPLSTPQRGIQCMHLCNSFISTTMCDDLARATEAQDGKNSGICDSSKVSPQLSIIVPSMGTWIVALKLIIARLLFQVSTAKSPLAASFSTAGN